MLTSTLRDPSCSKINRRARRVARSGPQGCRSRVPSLGKHVGGRACRHSRCGSGRPNVHEALPARWRKAAMPIQGHQGCHRGLKKMPSRNKLFVPERVCKASARSGTWTRSWETKRGRCECPGGRGKADRDVHGDKEMLTNTSQGAGESRSG